MTTHSVNQPWAITEKTRNRYGSTWADIDFVFHAKISEAIFKEDPMATSMGHLEVAGQRIKMRYKDMIAYAKSLSEQSASLCRANRNESFPIEIKTFTLNLRPIEVTRLAETMSDALTTAQRAYELGLYL